MPLSRLGRRQALCALVRAPRHPWLCLLVLLLLACPSPAAQAAGELQAGRYQLAGQPVHAELRPQGEGAWLISLWQGSLQAPAPGGLGLSARLLPEPGAGRLAGVWQSLAGACCPGQGRLEIEALSADSFAFRVFSPALDRPAWPLLADQVWRRVADLPPPERGLMLSGGWRLSLWYGDILPQGSPADPQEGLLNLSPQGDLAQGSWQGRPGRASLEPTHQGARLVYQDSPAGFELKADLRPLAQGLAHEGHFVSTLGEGRLLLVRQGLPAQPPEFAAAGQGELDGLWVDRRTGSDFMRLAGNAQALEFTAFGGERERPRYLSLGQARASAPGLLQGTGQDQKGQCCGNQGRLSFKLLSPERIEVRAFWWPIDQPDPGSPLEEPYLLERLRPASLSPARSGGEQWPEVFEHQPGLLPAQAGAMRVRFNWQPSAGGQVATLFCQGGYGQELDLFIDAQGRLAGRLATPGGLVSAQSQAGVSPRQDHEAWLIYQAGERLRLVLDGQTVASAPLPQPWLASASPYLVGASRWPQRDFEGAIASAELWGQAVDPAQPGPPSLTLNISPPPEGDEAAPAAAPATAPLMRLYHPRLLRHAYAVDPEQIQALHGQGYVTQGPLGRVWRQPQPGGQELWALRQPPDGPLRLQTQAAAPPGYEPLGRLGYVLGQPRGDSQPLHELPGSYEDPLRGGPVRDFLYTSRGDLLPRLQEQGYGQPRLLAHLAAEPEPTPQVPLTYTWPGVWAGEGWGRFFMLSQGQDLYLLWYYGQQDGPRYLAHLTLASDGRSAQGLAVGQPGPSATYYRLELTFDLAASQGPRLRLKSWRLAAPLDDGRLVSFIKPQLTESLLVKTGQALPGEETASLRAFLADASADPQAQYQAALAQAKSQDRLLER